MVVRRTTATGCPATFLVVPGARTTKILNTDQSYFVSMQLYCIDKGTCARGYYMDKKYHYFIICVKLNTKTSNLQLYLPYVIPFVTG